MNELFGNKEKFLVQEPGTQVKAGIVIVAKADVVRTPPPGMVEQFVLEKEQEGKRAMVEGHLTQWPRYGLKLFACQSCGSALPEVINSCQWGPHAPG